jgi:hypothetical protein
MKTRISNLSPHQNGKVFAVLMTVTSLIFVVPFMLIVGAIVPKGAGPSISIVMLIVMPLFYLVFGYISVAVGCWAYNLLAKFTGGIEFESQNLGG